MREKPEHQTFSFGNKHSNHSTHRCFYIDGRCAFAFFVDSETDINVILDDFFRQKDFISLKEYSAPDWDHVGLIDYFPESNEIFLTTNKKTKNLVLQDVSSSTIAKDTKKRLESERKIREEADYQERLAAEEKRKAVEFEKEQKKLAKLQKKANKGKAKKLADLEEGVSVTAGSEKPFVELIDKIEKEAKIIADEQKSIKPQIITVEKITQMTVSKKGIRSLI